MRACFLGQTVCALGNGYALVQMTPMEPPPSTTSQLKGGDPAPSEELGQREGGPELPTLRAFEGDAGAGRHSGCGFSGMSFR